MKTNEFFEKLKLDAKENNLAIVEKIQAAGKDVEAIYVIAKEAGVSDSIEEFKTEISKLQVLSEEDLLAVSGGLASGQVIIGNGHRTF